MRERRESRASRNTYRQRDVALRAALGATRTQLVRQLLTESVLLALAGGGGALIVGGWAIAYLSRVIIIPSALPLWLDLRLDARVLAVTAAATFVAAILTGLYRRFTRRAPACTPYSSSVRNPCLAESHRALPL